MWSSVKTQIGAQIDPHMHYNNILLTTLLEILKSVHPTMELFDHHQHLPEIYFVDQDTV